MGRFPHVSLPRGKYIGCVGKVAVSSSYRRQSAQGTGKPHFSELRAIRYEQTAGPG